MNAPQRAPVPFPTLESLRSGGKRELARTLALIETACGTPDLARLLDAAAEAPKAFVTGLTGPPGVGKSTLTNALVRTWRLAEQSVGVIAVDPSSRRTGGALLGDRARISTDPEDQGIFIRSMAARDRLGGLSDQTIAAVVLMRALFDHVLVESVGIGQSEADISFATDSVLLCIQPGSGDSLQFMKAGIMELPDIVAITKADMGPLARRTLADVEGALTLVTIGDGDWTPPVILVSATTHEGLDDLSAAMHRHRAHLADRNRLGARRAAQHLVWVEQTVRAAFGSEGWDAVRLQALSEGSRTPFQLEQRLLADLRARLGFPKP